MTCFIAFIATRAFPRFRKTQTDHSADIQRERHGIVDMHVLNQALQRWDEPKIVEQARPQPQRKPPHLSKRVFGQALELIHPTGAYLIVPATLGGTKA